MISILTPSIRPEGLRDVMESLERQTVQDFEWLVEIGTPWRGHDLSRAMNRMLRRAKGDLIVIHQDYIRSPDKALERVLEAHRLSPRTLYTYPVSKTHASYADLKRDWRSQTDGEIPYYQWETDFASAPRQAFLDVGGYDEEFDQGWSWENANLAHRASKAGYLFRCDQELECVAWDHDAEMTHPFRGKNENQERNKQKSLEIELDGKWKLNYL